MTLARTLLALVGLSAAAVVILFSLLVSRLLRSHLIEDALGSASLFVVAFLVAWCWTLIRSRGIGRIAWLPTVASLSFTVLVGNLLIWADISYANTKLAFFIFRVSASATLASTAAGLAFLARPFGITVIVRNVTIVVAAGSALATVLFALDMSDNGLLAFVVGFAFTLLSLAVLAIVHRITDPDDGRPAESVGLSLEIVCPRCRLHQTLSTGTSRCAGCRLTFRIEMEEPRCPQCRYLLHNLTQPRCPECGRALDPSDLPAPPAAGH